MQTLLIDVDNEDGTERLAAALARLLPRRALIGLDGPLGAGKTRLVRALASAAGADETSVSSPTFVLVHEYPGPQPIYHFDAYRLRRPADVLDLALDEYLASDGWTVIEWSERVAEFLPDERLAIRITPTGPMSRRFEIAAHGAVYEPIIASLAIEK